MTQYVELYLGEPIDNVTQKDFFKRARFVDAEPTTAPVDIPRHYNVQVTVSTEDGEFSTEIDSRTVNNWFNQFEPVIRKELNSDGGMDGEFRGNERNAKIMEILLNTVSAWINTNKAEKV